LPGAARIRGFNPASNSLAAKRIRQIGVARILYGSDAAVGDNLRPREGWEAFHRLPLIESEFQRIAGNVAPYLQSRRLSAGNE
jgi:hypothetical protein